MNIKLQTQDLHHTGSSLVTNYTWAHSLDNISSTFSDSLQGGGSRRDSAPPDTPICSIQSWIMAIRTLMSGTAFVVSPIWETPWYKKGKGLATNLAGGWSLVGVFTVRTGTPFSIYDNNNVSSGYTVPRLTPATPITQYNVGSPENVGVNLFSALSVPVPASFAPAQPGPGYFGFRAISRRHDWPERFSWTRGMELRSFGVQEIQSYGASRSGVPCRRI